MAGRLKPLDVERGTRPGKYADGDGSLSHRKGRDVEELDLSMLQGRQGALVAAMPKEVAGAVLLGFASPVICIYHQGYSIGERSQDTRADREQSGN